MTIARATDRRLFLLMERARGHLFRNMNKRLKAELGVSAVQGGALFHLGLHDGCLMGELAESLALTNSAVTGLAGRMENAGLVKRAPDKADGRAMRVALTKKGRALREDVLAQMKIFNAETAKDFPPEDMEAVYRFLNDLAVQAD